MMSSLGTRRHCTCLLHGVHGTLHVKGFLLPNLTELFLHSNRVKWLPKSIGQLKNLKILDVHNNQIETFPDEICELSNLLRILAGGNELKSLPENIGTQHTVALLQHTRVSGAVRCMDGGVNQWIDLCMN